MQGWGPVKATAQYCGVSERTLRGWLKMGLRHSRVKGGSVLIKKAWIDEFLEGFEVREDKANAIVGEILKCV